MDPEAVGRATARMAHEVVEQLAGAREAVLVGIQRRGVDLAAMIGEAIEDAEGVRLPIGTPTSPSTATTS